MDVGDGDAGGGGGVVDASRRRTRTGLGPVEAMECDEVDVLEKIGARTMRATVAICYVRYFRAPPKGRDWYGRTDGVIAAIRKHLSTALAMELEYRCATARLASSRRASPHRMVQEVVEQVWECLVAGTAWEDPGAAHGGGAVLAIDPGSKYEHEVLRKLEDGVSYKVTRDLVNRLLVRDGRAAVCETAVINCMRRCSPSYTSVQFVSQANRDGAYEWAIVRHRLTAQFRIQLGEWKPTLADLKGRGLVKATATSIPACFDRTQLESIALERSGFWDETHKKQRIGWEKPTASKGGVVLQFPRDPETGEYCPESRSQRRAQVLVVPCVRQQPGADAS